MNVAAYTIQPMLILQKQVTYNSSITGETQVTFDIQQYMNNRAMFIGLMCNCLLYTSYRVEEEKAINHLADILTAYGIDVSAEEIRTTELSLIHI